MSKSLYKLMNQAGSDAVAEDGRWLIGVPAIVAENQDPEKQHRVKVIIPTIDENLVFDEWARSFVFCLGNGFGTAFIPPKGSEVILIGQLGQKYNLFYFPVYNEELLKPDGLDDENNVGAKVPGNLTFVAELLAKIQAQNIEILAAQLAKTQAENIEILANQLAKMVGNTVEIDGQNSTSIGSSQIAINGSTISIDGSGSISLQGGNITIAGSAVTIHGRVVNKVGPPI